MNTKLVVIETKQPSFWDALSAAFDAGCTAAAPHCAEAGKAVQRGAVVAAGATVVGAGYVYGAAQGFVKGLVS